MPAPPLYPLRFTPIFKPAIWGGRRLAGMFPDAPAEGPIGEAWVLSDQGDSVSVVADGPLKGTTLRELMRDRREELLGPALVHHETFPLLLKFIDARENLSVQVHPNDEVAQALGCGPRGKTEAWIVLHAESGSRIFAGLKEGVDRPRLERAITDGTVADCLHSFEPNVGDCIYLPAGTVHALGGGITIFEVQQTSDITYRLFDWNRVDAKSGRARDLHVDEALATANFAQGPVRPIKQAEGADAGRLLADCPFFALNLAIFRSGVPLETDPKCRAIIPIRGELSLSYQAAEPLQRTNQVALIPAREYVYLMTEDQGSVSYLEIRPK
jgi:mannose-6-phosphate isomerase